MRKPPPRNEIRELNPGQLLAQMLTLLATLTVMLTLGY